MKSTCPICDNGPRTDEVDHASIASHFERELIEAQAQNELLRNALRPFGWYYALNDCHERQPDDALEVPIHDLKAAFDLVGGDPSDTYPAPDGQCAPMKEE
jgi:hypothetical protein